MQQAVRPQFTLLTVRSESGSQLVPVCAPIRHVPDSLRQVGSLELRPVLDGSRLKDFIFHNVVSRLDFDQRSQMKLI